jgi:predicted amidophosphoribosyltransferase
MMGFGFLIMLLVLAAPLVLIVALAIWLVDKSSQKNTFANLSSTQSAPAPSQQRVCSHCGTPLQANWLHCPQCGAATE